MDKIIKNIILIFMIIFMLLGNSLRAFTDADSVYYERLYYTGKVWGFVKYFHSEIAKGNINWDLVLLDELEKIKNSNSNEDFDNNLLNILNNAGPMAQPSGLLPNVVDSLRFNLDLDWIQDNIFSDGVTAKLDTIKNQFRPQNNYYVDRASNSGTMTFENDAQFYDSQSNFFPDEEYRLLALFRYWNIINYFFPYKNIIDQNWDSTLREFIPKVINASSEISYHSVFMELSTRINDSHAYTSSTVINRDIRGYYYLPLALKYIENKTVITCVLTQNEEVKLGDVIKSINGVSIDSLRDSLRTTTQGSNPPTVERNINSRLLRGKNEIVQMVVENNDGQREISIARITSSVFYDLREKTGPIWEILNNDNIACGYVDMGRLQIEHIESMFNDLWETDGIIFDIRSYPQGTMWDMINYLFDQSIHNAKFTYPDISYPGTLYWSSSTVGSGDFSKTYNKYIFILINEETQSQAEYTAMSFERHPLAIKIGSQTAGADGNTSSIYLPGRITTKFTGLGVFYPDYTETQRIGIVPDIEVHPTLVGIREQRDELIEAAIVYLKEISVHLPYKIPDGFILYQNYPNPFNPNTAISYNLPEDTHVKITIYDMLGKEIAELISLTQYSGSYSIQWNGVDYHGNPVSTGIYFYKLQAGDFIQTKKMLLMK